MNFLYTYFSPGTLHALSVLDIILSLVWILIALFILFIYRNGKNTFEYKYFIPFFLFKTAGLLGLTLLYVYYYGGGDSVAYWGTSNALVDLSMQDFSGFLREMFSATTETGRINEFSLNNIRYPSWITRESEGYFVGKAGWFFNLISAKNYLLSSLYFMLFAFVAHWKLYRFLVTYYRIPERTFFHALFLFIPSIAFWNTGLSKDALVLIGTLHLTRHVLAWFVFKERGLKRILWMLFYSWLLLQTREITFVILVGSLGLAWLISVVGSISSKFFRMILRVFLLGFGAGLVIVSFVFFGAGDFVDIYLDEAAIIAQDFAENVTYTGARYDLGVSDYSYAGIIKAAPMAVLAGIFRPFIWESFSVTLFLNGIEGTLFLFLFFKNIVFKWRTFLQIVINNYLLLFAVLFVVFFAFTTGLTANIFGVLVRLRAPLLLFFVIAAYYAIIANSSVLSNPTKNENLE